MNDVLSSRTDAPDQLIELIGTADIPGGGELLLRQRGDDYAIEYGDVQLMVSWASRSERALASLACQRVTSAQPHILIGGLGMGFTLVAALADLPAAAKVVVAELVPAVVEWAEGPLAHLFDGSLSDPRVAIRVGDVFERIAESHELFDAILLDVDNGPDGLISASNDRLYSMEGLATSHAALRPGGVLAIWSSYPDNRFGDDLEEAGFIVDEIRMRSGENGRGDRHIIWLAIRPHGEALV